MNRFCAVWIPAFLLSVAARAQPTPPLGAFPTASGAVFRVWAPFADSAAALEEWHRAGRTGPRPPGRLRPLAPPRLNPLTIALAAPAYLWLHDPDGRPWRLRLKRRY